MNFNDVTGLASVVILAIALAASSVPIERLPSYGRWFTLRGYRPFGCNTLCGFFSRGLCARSGRGPEHNYIGIAKFGNS